MNEVSTAPKFPTTRVDDGGGDTKVTALRLDYSDPYAQPADAVVWSDDDERLSRIMAEEPPGYGGDGALLVRLSVDGAWDQVDADLGSTDQVEALDRAIVALTRTRDVLAGVPGRALGRCMAQGDWGRCYSRTGHDGGHDFPAEPA